MTLSNSDSISVTNLEKKFGAFVAVNKITFSVKKGEIFGFSAPTAPVNPLRFACFAALSLPHPVRVSLPGMIL